MRASRFMRGLLLQFLLEWFQELVEYVEEQTVRLPNNRSQIVLHQGRKHDRSHRVRLARLVDSGQCLLCLVIRIYKWQSHLAKIVTDELGQQAVAQRFGGYSGLVR